MLWDYLNQIKNKRKKIENASSGRKSIHLRLSQLAIREKAQVASMFDGERTLIWGESMFLNMMVQDFTCKAENVVTFVSKEPEKLLEKCKEFQPTILVLTGEPENLPEFLKQIAPGCPDAAIIISSSKPELLPYSKSELEAAHVCAVLKKPFVREDFLDAIQNIKDNK